MCIEFTFMVEGFGAMNTLQVLFSVLNILIIVSFLRVICNIFFSTEFCIAMIAIEIFDILMDLFNMLLQRMFQGKGLQTYTANKVICLMDSIVCV